MDMGNINFSSGVGDCSGWYNGNRITSTLSIGTGNTCNIYITKQNSEKEKIEMKSQAIVDLYFSNLKAASKEKNMKIINELTAADPIVSEIQQKVNEIRNIIAKNKESIADRHASFDVEIGDLITVDTEVAITKAYKEKIEEDSRLNSLKKEIITMLAPCETYSEEMEILFAYDIIDDDGKLIHPELQDGTV